MLDIPKKMKAIAVDGKNHISIKEVSTPNIKRRQALIRIDHCLLCTWEQRIFTGVSSMGLPFIAGHEAAGEIVAIDDSVPSNFKIGDRVSFKTLDHCGHCKYCYQGDHNQCIGKAEKRDYDGIPGSGGLAQYIALDFDRIFPIYNIDTLQASFTEPLACCLHSVKRANLEFGSRVAVVGAGVMGQLHAILARLSGAKVIVVEPDAARRALAMELGAHATIDPINEDEKMLLDKYTNQQGLDAAFVTTTQSAIAKNYIDYLEKMGVVIFYGSFYPDTPIELSPNHIHYSEKAITGSASPSVKDLYLAATMLSQELFPIKKLLSETYSLDEAQKAFEKAVQPDALRVAIALHD